ncbi:MAG: DNA-protecting protein DprA [Planctomycetota bacterium]|nr:MAG: DNA-protecting protein DprA [Planctomycetota bacterium]
MKTDEDRAYLALNALPGMGPVALSRLVRVAGSAAALLEAPERHAAGAKGALLRGWTRERLRSLAEQEAHRLQRCGAAYFTCKDSRYPEPLRNLHFPPAVLAYRGSLEALEPQRLRIAVVGARACTPYGRTQAARFGSGLAAAGVVVVSGAARGIDQAGMEGALDAEGAVVAVLGSGMDCPYPPENRPLLERIVAGGGLLLSEFPCGRPPLRMHFPQRNRVLAGLVRGVLVVQATNKSGSMITVDWAIRLGREVFALPGPVDSPVSEGTHQLLRDGCRLAAAPCDILEEYGWARGGQAPPLPLQLGASAVAQALAQGDASADDLAAQLHQPVEAVLVELAQLELNGAAVRLPGGVYHRCGPAARRAHAPRTGPNG